MWLDRARNRRSSCDKAPLNPDGVQVKADASPMPTARFTNCTACPTPATPERYSAAVTSHAARAFAPIKPMLTFENFCCS